MPPRTAAEVNQEDNRMRSMYKYLFLYVAVAVIFAASAGCNGTGGDEAGAGDVLEVDKQAGGQGGEDGVYLYGMDGHLVNLSERLEEKPLYITFFAGYCDACKREIPRLNEIHGEFARKDLITMYAVNLGDPKGRVEAMIERRGIEYPVLLDQKKAAQREFGVVGLPTNLVLGRGGEELYRSANPPDDELLGEVIARW